MKFCLVPKIVNRNCIKTILPNESVILYATYIDWDDTAPSLIRTNIRLGHCISILFNLLKLKYFFRIEILIFECIYISATAFNFKVNNFIKQNN